MAIQHTLSVYWVRLIYDLIEKQGLNAQQMFTAAGLNAADLANPGAQFCQDGLTRLWKAASKASGNPAIGLALGDNPNIMAFDAYSASQISSRTVSDALQRAVRYQRIVGAALNLAVEQGRDACVISFSSESKALVPAREGFDAGLALTLASLRLITQQNIVPLWVEFAYPQVADLRPYQALFNCPLKFAAPRYCLALAPAVLELPMLFANPQLALNHQAEIERSLQQGATASTVEKVREFIVQSLPSGEPTLAQAAEYLNSSRRSLQRHLQGEQSSFRSLLDEVRCSLALQYLKQDLPLQEITFLLGFADHGNFYRAFRRWYGQPPGRYKQALLE